MNDLNDSFSGMDLDDRSLRSVMDKSTSSTSVQDENASQTLKESETVTLMLNYIKAKEYQK